MRGGSLPTIQPRVVQALQACPDPLGASMTYLKRATGLTQRQVSSAFMKLNLRGQRFAIIKAQASRYFATQAQRDAAAALLDEAVKLKARTRPRRASKVNRPIREALEACQDRFGMTARQLRQATGLTSKAIGRAVSEMRKAGSLFACGSNPDTHYFATQAQRDAAAPALAEHVARVRLERAETAKANARRRAKQLYDERMRLRPPRPKAAPKKKRAPRPVALLPPKPVNPAEMSRKRFLEQQPIIPPGLKKKVIPGCPPDYRYHVSPHFKGEFTRAGIGRYPE